MAVFFSEDSDRFWQTAQSLARVCQLAGARSDDFRNEVRSLGLDRVRKIEVGPVTLLDASAGSTRVLAFSDHPRLAQWLLDLPEDDDPSQRADSIAQALGQFVSPCLDELERELNAAYPGKAYITGHGVGGAMAHIFAERLRVRPLRTISFGAPTGVPPRPYRIHRHYRSSYISSNLTVGHDLIARLGTRYWRPFLIEPTPWSNLRRSILDMRPLNSAELAAALTVLRKLRHRHKSDPPDQFERIATSVHDGLAAHTMTEYLGALSRAAMRERMQSELGDEDVEARAEELGRQLSRQKKASARALAHVAPNWRAPENVTVNAAMGSIVSLQGPPEALYSLARDPDVLRIDAEEHLSSFELARSVPFVDGHSVQRATVNERGAHAVVGLIDTGIDVLHRAFHDDYGRSRVLAVWDQTDQSGGPDPRSLDPNLPTGGRLYLKKEIDTFIAGVAPTPRALRDPKGHGTHVASIAAGRAVGSLSEGMAPDSPIMVVIPDLANEDGVRDARGYAEAHISAFDFLLTAARGGYVDGVDRPIAINCSSGINAGAHDGTSMLEKIFDGAIQGHAASGVAVIKSAGNLRDKKVHTRLDAPNPGVTRDVRWTSLNAARGVDLLQFWYARALDLSFTLIAPSGASSATISHATRHGDTPILDNNLCDVRARFGHPDNGMNLLQVSIRPHGDPIKSGDWKLRISTNALIGVDPRIDAWIECDDRQFLHFDAPDEETTLTIPGTARSVITVGACAFQTPATVATPYSSCGLTRDGVTKPDLVAPGDEVVGARSNQPNHVETTSDRGTSVAAPHVTGAVALAFSMRRRLGQRLPNATEIKASLSTTTRNATGHGTDIGHGLLDTVAFLRDVAAMP